MATPDSIEPNTVFYRDLLVKMMGFGLAVLFVISGWMIGTTGQENFDWFDSKDDLKQEAKRIALVYGEEDSRAYKIKLYETEIALEMRWDRAKGALAILGVGALVWAISVCLVRCKAGSHPTVFAWWIIGFYCAAIILPYIFIGYLLFT